MKKILSIVLLVALTTTMFVGCKSKETQTGKFDKTKDITVVSREDGSGTRGAFIELFKIQVKGADGSKTDKTTKEAVIANKTDIMLTNVSGDDYAIGYVSLGSLNDTVKALNVDGVKATAQNVKSGEYKVARPFVIATKGETTGLKKDFIDFILSKEGQVVVSKSYISVSDDAVAYSGDRPTGKLVIAGSSSVTPIMEKLKEAYLAMNPNAEIQIQQSDSTAGMTGTIEGTCDIGMASRDLKDSEKGQLTGTSIAIDGIAVIINPNNTLSDITTEQVNKIFTGKSITWDEV
ncbi:MAG: substrate-binding domain-containing protein [Oscillospiraceae bacterium]